MSNNFADPLLGEIVIGRWISRETHYAKVIKPATVLMVSLKTYLINVDLTAFKDRWRAEI